MISRLDVLFWTPITVLLLYLGSHFLLDRLVDWDGIYVQWLCGDLVNILVSVLSRLYVLDRYPCDYLEYENGGNGLLLQEPLIHICIRGKKCCIGC